MRAVQAFASVINNTTWDLVADIERIRKALGIEKWIAFGGSWGATLALIYAETHPERVRNIILRGVFMMTQAELDWFYGGGAGKFWPDLWARFTGLIPEAEHGDLIAAYHRRLFCGDRMTEVKYGKAWAAWENALASIHASGGSYEGPGNIRAPSLGLRITISPTPDFLSLMARSLRMWTALPISPA